MNDNDRRYWFRAKRFGWGWGLPVTWQGWTVLIVWFAIFIPGLRWAASQGSVYFYVFLMVMVFVLIAICYAKGEPPRWRWGDKS